MIALLATVFSAPGRAEDPLTQPKLVGSLARYPADIAKRLGVKTVQADVGASPNGSVVASQTFDRLYQMWNLGNHEKLGTGFLIAERDLGTLRLLRHRFIPGRLAARANNGPGAVEFITTFDNKNGRLFIEYGLEVLDSNAGADQYRFGILAFDLRTLEFTDNDYPRGVIRATYKGQAVGGLEYDESTDTLLAVLNAFDENVNLASVVSIVGWSGSEFAEGGLLANMQGPRVIRSCRQNPIGNLSANRATPILVHPGPDLTSTAEPKPIKNWVIIPCFNTPYSVNVVLARIDRDTLFQNQGSETAVPTPSGVGNWIVDPTHGRLHLVNYSQETDNWVYEVTTNAFVGIIELSPKGQLNVRTIGMGVDEINGRLVVFGPHHNERGKTVSSLMVAQAAQDPVPQADIYNLEGTEDADAPLVVDGKRNRVMLLRRVDPAGSIPLSWAPKYEVYEIPAATAAQEEVDPDSLTKQVAEADGKTLAEYGGTATAYGVRVLLAGGFGGVVPSNGNHSVGQVYRDVNSQCGLRDRNIVIGGPAEAELGNSVRDAFASGITVDGASKLDFGQPSRCDLYFQYWGPLPDTQMEQPVKLSAQQVRDVIFFSGLMRRLDREAPQTGPWETRFNDAVSPHTRWEYVPAECTSKDQRDEPGQNAEYFAGETRVECTKPRMISASAEGRAVGALGDAATAIPVTIGRAVAWTEVRVDPVKGLVSTAVARAENIQIGPVSIGWIENRAVAYSKGRMGTAYTETYAPKVVGVRGPNMTGCELRCDLDTLIPQINNALSGRAELRRIGPDENLQKGSPGGYQSGVIKSPKQSSSDNSLVGDKSREVPALELIVYNDNPRLGRARQIVQFAGVRADSHYGIQVFDEAADCPECDDAPDQPTIVEVPGPERVVEVPGPARTRRVTRTVPQLAVPGGYRLLLANPRAAGAMATVWLLLAAPAVVAARRRRLRQLQ